jgi:uracil-DNA glycosylase
MLEPIPAAVADQINLAHASWQPELKLALQRVHEADPTYLPALAKDHYLPTQGRLFAAFQQPLDAVKYVLVGEGPYPREESATGVCFMDGAVKDLWSEKGLSKPVNRATSLRNFMKMLLVADGSLEVGRTSGEALAHIAQQARNDKPVYIQTLPDLQEKLTQSGFLLLNASLVYRPHVAPAKDAKAWRPFLERVLIALDEHAGKKGRLPPTLVLWGKIAELVGSIPTNAHFPKAISEHPYNISFIASPTMQALFKPMGLLRR